MTTATKSGRIRWCMKTKQQQVVDAINDVTRKLHTLNVLDNAQKIISERNKTFVEQSVSLTVAAVHRMGKATTMFQLYDNMDTALREMRDLVHIIELEQKEKKSNGDT